MRLALALASILALTACKPDGPEFRQISYFKSDTRDRVFVVQAKSDITPKEADQFASKQMNTAGRVTMVYVYEASAAAPGDLVTHASDLFSTNETMMGTSAGRGWRWYFLRDRSGISFFIDCKLHADDVCNP